MSELVLLADLLDLLLEVLIALVPMILILIFFQIFVFKLGKSEILNMVKGFLMTYAGLVMFLYGVKIGFMPAGRFIGEAIGGSDYSWVLIPTGFALGFAVTIVEPAIRVLCTEVEKVSSGYIREKTMLFTLSFGVAISVALALAKTIYGFSLAYLLIPGYAIAFILAILSGRTFTAVAFDSGGVATGPMVVTFIMAISIGLAEILKDRDPVIHGFGLVSLVALAPILSVLILGLAYRIKEGFKGENNGRR